MKFRMSPNVAVRTDRFSDAVNFYLNVLGFKNRSTFPSLGNHDASSFTLYVDKDEEISGLGMELFVEDLEVSRDEFLKMDAKSFDGEARARIVIYEIPLG